VLEGKCSQRGDKGYWGRVSMELGQIEKDDIGKIVSG